MVDNTVAVSIIYIQSMEVNCISGSSYHITCTGKVIVEQAFQGHPADRPVLIIPQTVVIHGKEISGEGIVCNLHLHVVVNAVGGGKARPLFLTN